MAPQTDPAPGDDAGDALVDALVEKLTERGVPQGCWLLELEQAIAAVGEVDGLLRRMRAAILREAGPRDLLVYGGEAIAELVRLLT
jgi:hypothetical protein